MESEIEKLKRINESLYLACEFSLIHFSMLGNKNKDAVELVQSAIYEAGGIPRD